MSNRIYSKNAQQSVSTTEARIAKLLNALPVRKLSNIVSAVKCVTCYAWRTVMAATAATVIYWESKGKEAVNQPKDYAQPLKISGLKEIVARLTNGSN